MLIPGAATWTEFRPKLLNDASLSLWFVAATDMILATAFKPFLTRFGSVGLLKLAGYDGIVSLFALSFPAAAIRRTPAVLACLTSSYSENEKSGPAKLALIIFAP